MEALHGVDSPWRLVLPIRHGPADHPAFRAAGVRRQGDVRRHVAPALPESPDCTPLPPDSDPDGVPARQGELPPVR